MKRIRLWWAADSTMMKEMQADSAIEQHHPPLREEPKCETKEGVGMVRQEGEWMALLNASNKRDSRTSTSSLLSSLLLAALFYFRIRLFNTEAQPHAQQRAAPTHRA
jgi:hypothetical protein